MSPPFDPNIPVLTEILHGETPRSDAAPDSGLDRLDAQDAIERRISARIMLQLQDRVDAALADLVHRALAGLGNDLRQGLQLAIEESVVHAVNEELKHLSAQKK